jgi:GTPase-associated protein 1, N-terminal domain type 2/GTPase-associated protein 1, C-terminal domain/GTPase-associated protein 1, middle domain
MAFMQLYYTSCEHGLSGYPGYQFNAATPGVPVETMREVERLTAYEPPAGLAHEEAGASLDEYPVTLCSWRGELAVTANAVFVGADFSNRFGNYFVHALVSASPGDDLGGVLPIELWQCPIWIRQAVTSTSLEPLPGPPPPGPLDRAAVQGFLRRHPGADRLPALLTAAVAAVAGERPVVLVSHDTEDNACWIAALSYLLPGSVVERLSFTTYHRRPTYCPFHVVGTLAGAELPEADGCALFDFVGERSSEVTPHPMAALLAAAGPRLAGELWRRVEALAGGGEASPDAWHGPAAAAASTLGIRLSAADVIAASDWFVAQPGRGLPDPALAAMAAEALLAHASGDPRRQAAIGAAARRTGVGNRVAGLDSLEERLIEDELSSVAAGGARGWAPELDSPRLQAHAGRRCEELLAAAAPVSALGLLQWAASRGVPIGEAALVACGGGLADRLGEAGGARQVRAALADWPAVRRGLAGELARRAGADAEGVTRLFEGELSVLLDEPELAAVPFLGDLRVLRDAGRDPGRRVAALAAMLADRPGPRPAAQLEDVLPRLWPDRRWRVIDAIQALGVMPQRLHTSPVLARWLTAPLLAAPDPEDARAWDSYCHLGRVVAAHPVRVVLPDEVTAQLGLLRRAEDAERIARESGGRAAALVTELAGELRGASPAARQTLVRRLPDLLVAVAPSELADALSVAPSFAVAGYLQRIHQSLDRGAPNVGLAGALFVAGRRLEAGVYPNGRLVAGELLQTLPRWRADDLDALQGWLDRTDPQVALAFHAWRQQHEPAGLRGQLLRLFRRSRGERGPGAGSEQVR